MRVAISYLLLFAFIMQYSAKVAIVIHFKLNQATISKNLCENKFNPKLKCNGKCQLRKQLAKQEKKETSIPNLLIEKTQPLFIHQNQLTLSNLNYKIVKHTFKYLLIKSTKQPVKLLRPPANIC